MSARDSLQNGSNTQDDLSVRVSSEFSKKWAINNLSFNHRKSFISKHNIVIKGVSYLSFNHRKSETHEKDSARSLNVVANQNWLI